MQEQEIRLHFMDMLTRGCGLQELLDYTEELTGTPVLMQDGTMYTQGVSRGYPAEWTSDFSMVVLPDPEQQNRLCADFETALEQNASIRILDYPHMPGRTVLLPIYVEGRLSAILRFTEKDVPLEQVPLSLFKLLQEIYPLIARLNDSTQVSSLPERALKRLFSGTLADPVLIANCDVLSVIAGHSQYQLLCLCPTDNRIPYILNAVREQLGTDWIAEYDGTVCLLGFSNEQNGCFSRKALDGIASLAAQEHCGACLSDEFTRLEYAFPVFRHVRSALGRVIRPEDGLVSYDACRLDLLLERIREKYDPVFDNSRALKSLIDYDANGTNSLLETLRAYLDAHCSVAETASRLFVHKNTVLYRLQRIREISGLDLSDPRCLVETWISLFLLERPQVKTTG